MIEAERAALRRRYAEERDKRLRPDGNDQYLELKGQFGGLLKDPIRPVHGDHRHAAVNLGPQILGPRIDRGHIILPRRRSGPRRSSMARRRAARRWSPG